MTATFAPHRRQFLIDQRERPPLASWRTLEIGPQRYLHHCPTLPVAHQGDRLVVGLALDVGDDTGGRYLTIRDGWLTTDTSSLLGVYHASTDDGLLVSSSSALLGPAAGAPRVSRRLAWYSLNWYPLPGSGRVGVSKMLPASSLDLDSGEVRVQPVPGPSSGSVEQRAEQLATALTAPLGQLTDRSTVWVALTAGLDSRTVLAAALHAGCRVQTFTQAFPGLPDVELAIARAVAAQAGIPHRTVAFGASRRVDRAAVAAHSDGESADADRWALARGGWTFVGPHEPVLRGGIFEYGRRFFADAVGHLSGAEVDADPTRVTERVRMGPHARRSFGAGLQTWAEARRGDPPAVHWMDRFYLDQRVAGWLAAIEQLLDGVLDASIHLANSRLALEAVAAGPDDDPIGDAVQRQTIEMLAPGLISVPVNPDAVPERWRHTQQRIRSLGRLVGSEFSSTVASAR